MNAIDQHQVGLYNKFKVSRTDGKDALGEKHYGDEYFVLNLTTDKKSIPAIAAYAKACENEHPTLAADLRAFVVANIEAESIYITVPEVTLKNGLIVPSFRVGKYISSRSVADTLVSIAENKPWVDISYFDAMKACASAGLDPLFESRALAIAQDISQQDINWTGGKVGEGKIFQGIHKGNVSEAQDGTYESSDPEERRWHELSNGERIYDFSGNCFTWVSDDVQGDENGITGKIAADSISLTTAPFPSQKNGVGWYPAGGCNWSGHALVRGGCFGSRSDAGVFYLNHGSPVYRGDNVGVRCTKSL